MPLLDAPPQYTPAVLHDIDWSTYSRFLRLFADRRFRHTYDRGRLEIMSPLLLEHEGPAYMLGRLIDVLTDELLLPCRAGRSVTLRRKQKKRGLEPDNCYWIANASRLQSRGRIDLSIDPPPDLAIEVDYTSSSLKRMSIYASLGVPEIWRLKGERLQFYILHAKTYHIEAKSIAFPHLASVDLEPFVKQFGEADDTLLVRQFREWVRAQLPTWQAANDPETSA